MGQQQLLLLVLTAIIVALATLAGIQAFSESQRQSAINHITQKAVEIGGDVQEYAQRPDFMRPKNTTGDSDLEIDFSELPHYETKEDGYGGDHVDPYATYSLNGYSTLPDGYKQSACPVDESERVNAVHAYSGTHDVSVCVAITGTSAEDLQAGVAQ